MPPPPARALAVRAAVRVVRAVRSANVHLSAAPRGLLLNPAAEHVDHLVAQPDHMQRPVLRVRRRAPVWLHRGGWQAVESLGDRQPLSRRCAGLSALAGGSAGALENGSPFSSFGGAGVTRWAGRVAGEPGGELRHQTCRAQALSATAARSTMVVCADRPARANTCTRAPRTPARPGARTTTGAARGCVGNRTARRTSCAGRGDCHVFGGGSHGQAAV